MIETIHVHALRDGVELFACSQGVRGVPVLHRQGQEPIPPASITSLSVASLVLQLQASASTYSVRSPTIDGIIQESHELKHESIKVSFSAHVSSRVSTSQYLKHLNISIT